MKSPRWPDDVPILTSADIEERPLTDWLVVAFRDMPARNQFFEYLAEELGRRSKMCFGLSIIYYLQHCKPQPLEQANAWNSALVRAGYEIGS